MWGSLAPPESQCQLEQYEAGQNEEDEDHELEAVGAGIGEQSDVQVGRDGGSATGIHGVLPDCDVGHHDRRRESAGPIRGRLPCGAMINGEDDRRLGDAACAVDGQ